MIAEGSRKRGGKKDYVYKDPYKPEDWKAKVRNHFNHGGRRLASPWSAQDAFTFGPKAPTSKD